jgi:signal peptidase
MPTSVHRVARGQIAGPALGWVRRLAGGLAGAIGVAVLAGFAGLCLLLAFGHRPMIEMSDSMAPMVRAGDVLFIKRIAAAQAGPGDVITFSDPEREGRTITHRVVSVAATGSGQLAFVTQGDANTGVERWRTRPDAAIGRYAFRVPALGRAVHGTRSIPWRAAVALAGLVLTLDLMRRLWRTPPPPAPTSTPG